MAKPFTWTDKSGLTITFPTRKAAATFLGVEPSLISYYARKGYSNHYDLKKNLNRNKRSNQVKLNKLYRVMQRMKKS